MAVQLLTDLRTCIVRVHQRTDHPTLGPDNADTVCRRMYADFQVVQDAYQEGFDEVLSVRHPGELMDVTGYLARGLAASLDATREGASMQPGAAPGRGGGGEWSGGE